MLTIALAEPLSFQERSLVQIHYQTENPQTLYVTGPDATSPLGLASAYSTLAAGGTQCDVLPVTEVLDRDGSDPKNCPMCALAVTDPEAADAPERRYAMNVFKYKTKPNSFDVAVPFSGEILQWSFTPRTFNKIVDIAEEFGDLQLEIVHCELCGDYHPPELHLTRATLSGLVRGIVSAFLEQGVRNVVLLNGHYENYQFLYEGVDLALRDLGIRPGDRQSVLLLSYWDYVSEETLARVYPDGFPGWDIEHGGVLETSLMLHLEPELVRVKGTRGELEELSACDGTYLGAAAGAG